MSTLKARHAAAQRRHAAKLRTAGAPRGDDIGRALVHAARACLAGGVRRPDDAAWEKFVKAVVEHLVMRGFDRGEARRRLKRALLPR